MICDRAAGSRAGNALVGKTFVIGAAWLLALAPVAWAHGAQVPAEAPVAVKPAARAPNPANEAKRAQQALIRQPRQNDRFGSGVMVITPNATQEPPPWSPELMVGVVPDPKVTALVRALDARDYAERSRATAGLLDRAIPDEQVWAHLLRGGLSAEAHARLLEVGRIRIVNAPRGALGIQMAGRFEETDGVTVTGLVPNMPAEKVIQRGDRIVMIDGQPIQVSQQLTAVVQMRRPGDRVKVVVMRGERDALGRVKGDERGKPVETRVEVELELGSREDLDRFGDGGVDVPQLEGGRDRMALLLVDTFPGPRTLVPIEVVPGESPDVDSHPDIAQLREMLSRPDEMSFGSGMRAMLRARLSALEAAARVPGLEAGERAWLQAVADRFKELIPVELRPDSPVVPQTK